MIQKFKTAVYAGSFDPFTIGHADIVERALRIFDKVVIAIGYNENKKYSTNVEQRLANITALYRNEPRVTVKKYIGLTADFALSISADAVLLRGVRDISDYASELQLADTNRLISGIETVLLTARPELSCISSSMVRELLHNGCNVDKYLPKSY